MALALAAALACHRDEPCGELVSDGQYVMGTVLEIQLCAPDRASGERPAVTGAVQAQRPRVRRRDERGSSQLQPALD